MQDVKPGDTGADEWDIGDGDIGEIFPIDKYKLFGMALLIEATRASAQDMQARLAGDGGLSGISLKMAKLVLFPDPRLLTAESATTSRTGGMRKAPKRGR